jgi:hypothetical protein
MRSLKLLLTLKFILLFSLSPTWGQGDYGSDDYEIEARQGAADQLEATLQSSEQDAQAILKEMQKIVPPEEMAKLQKAIESGDQELIRKTMNKLNLEMAKSGKGLDAMVDLSLRSFQGKSPQDLRDQLEERFKDSLVEPLFEFFPKLLDFGVNFLQDPVAAKSLAKIAADRKRLLIFLGINILLFIFKKIHQRLDKRMGGLTRWMLFASLRFAVLIFFFHKELWPTFVVFKRTFF